MELIKIVVQGAQGKMGQEVLKALCQEPETQVVGATEIKVSQVSLQLPDGSGSVPFSTDLDQILNTCQPDVLVDFSLAPAVMPAVRMATPKKIHLVIGTTGLSAHDLEEIDSLSRANKVGAIVAPNFALGAIMMIHLAKIAAKYLDYAEIIELHHDKKVDAPSGTSQNTARTMVQSRGKPFLHPAESEQVQPSRGEQVEGINIHSVRLPGLLAHQEVILGAPGQTLRIRHDQINREAFMPGVILAVKEVIKRQGLIYGLDALLNL
jgi:4-hydroxy-tetrahydrodipicolinate reductase